MADTRGRRLADFCRERVGPSLRAVVRYDDEGLDVVHLRDDLRANYTKDRFAGLVDTARGVHDQVAPLRDLDAPLGAYGSAAHTFEHAVVLQFVVDDETGYLASFDRDVGAGLTEFASACLAALEGD